MGLLSFLKKGERKSIQGFDAPDDLELPPPPQIGGGGGDLPSFAGPRMAMPAVQMPPPVKGNPALPEFKPEHSEPALPEIKPISFDFSKDFPMDELPKAASFEPKETPEVQFSAPVSQSQMVELGRAERPDGRSLLVEKPVFVKAHEFRQIVEDIGAIVSHPVRADSADSARFRAAEDAEYDKLGNLLEDVQRDLMFVDKTLFEV